MMKKYITLIIISFGLLFFSGCGQIDCSEQDSKYTKYEYDVNSEECVIAEEIPKDECGNGIAEDGETFCNCPDDVKKSLPASAGGCDGSKSEFLEYACDNQEECVLVETDKVSTTTKVMDFKGSSDFTIEAKVNYPNPFMIDRHEFDIEFMLKNIRDEETLKIKNLMIKDVSIITSSSELLGSETVDITLSEQFEKKNALIGLDGFSFEEFEKDIGSTYIKLLITYTREVYDRDGTLTKTEDKSIELKYMADREFSVIDPENDFGSE